MTGDSSRWSWILLKAEAARSECEGDGAFDVEALFASQEKAKPPNILAAGAGYQLKAEAAHSESLLLCSNHTWSYIKLYR
ncbi:hypothetical protein JDS77_11595 [Bacillus cereus group sp. N28]|uniref:hypothetical protein n=1 Tax=Bacillus cereus group sp. N28 TaxID=2794593 RepID=UPI0018F389D7|nr:hypothetical protein [Bacillus cereus group sp. N28]MBJ7958341.1 hypothetical protein [Bacillus cereus group sp. N28]